ncbi:MAG TPA: tetratricopeptide repeat protein, partial [Kofleriaceae bacterium]
NLRRFELVGARRPLQASTLAAVLSSCPRLLDLTWSARDLDFEILERHPRLERLAFWDSVTAEQLDRLVRGPWPLRALGYRAQVPAPLVPASIAEIVAGTGFPALTELAISNGGFDPALIEALVGSRLADRLTVLALDWGRVTNEALAAARETLARTQLGSPRPSTDPVEVANAYRLSARYREGLGRPREALPHAELATSTDPDHYYSWCELGYVHDALHQDDAVVRAIDRAITIDPERPNARYWRADALVHLRRFAEAEQDLLFALPRDAAMAGYIHGRLGRLYARWNRSDDARAAYIRAIADSARDVDQRSYTSSLVREMLEVGEIAAATTALAYQNQHFPADRPRELDGIVAFAEGNFARAAEIARAIPAGVSGEGCFSWYLLESASLCELGRLDEANARYQQIIDTADCPAWIAHCWLGQTLLGADPFAAIGGVTPHEIDDQVAAAVRTETHAVHDTRTHPADRFQVTICAIAADLLCGRATAARVTAFEAECRAAVRAPGPWDSTSMIVRITRARLAESDGAVLRRIYALASGHA